MFAGSTGTLTFTKLTPAADIYSLAKSAYVLITCESPRFFANQPITELPFAFRQKSWADDLIKVLNKATQNDSRERHQTVNEFWQDLSHIKILAERDDGESIAEISTRPHTVPQAHVAKGYTPLAPERPRFNTSRELKINNSLLSNNAPLVVRLEDAKINQSPNSQPHIIERESAELPKTINKSSSKRNKDFLRRFATFIIFIGLFAGILYATHNYLRGRGILPAIGNPFSSQQEAVALMDINLRPESNANKRAIGLVSKDSRLRIKSVEDNWYEVDIIEHGRPKENEDWAEHGWISGKTRFGDETLKILR
jgi:serine/threonine protein kinase